MRLFVAVDLPDAARATVGREIAALERAGADVRWVSEPRLHLTLKFIGDVVPDRIDALRDTLRRLARPGALALGLRGLGRFPPAGKGAPRVFWAGVDGAGIDRLVRLATALDEACAAHGVEREQRTFTPHLTLGRVRSSRNLRTLEDLVEQRGAGFAVAMSPISTLRLYRSELRPAGSAYTVIEEFPLA